MVKVHRFRLVDALAQLCSAARKFGCYTGDWAMHASAVTKQGSIVRNEHRQFIVVPQ